MKTILRAVLLAPVLAGLAAVAVPAAAGASSGAAPAATKRIASCRAHGQVPHCGTNSKHPKVVSSPVSIHVHMTSTTAGPLDAGWAISCTKGTVTKIKTKTVKGTGTSLTRKVKFPMSHPDSCLVIANGALVGTGKIHVWATART
jgi:hypothetical protein